MDLLSSVRAYVGGESQWSKGQKDATHFLNIYAQTRDENDYQRYLKAIAAPLGDHRARLALEQSPPDLKAARQGFLDGNNHPDDVSGIITLFLVFRHTPLMEKPIAIWTEGDVYLGRLDTLAQRLHANMTATDSNQAEQAQLLAEINAVSLKLTPLEDAFSRTLAVMFLDVDHFKDINDTLGHDKGDQLLRQTAERLLSCVRDSDTVARFGGDEFVVLLSQFDDLGAVDLIAQRMLATMNEPFQLDSELAYVSVSIGITVYPVDADTHDQLIKNADQAMYEVKKNGRNSFTYFTRTMQEAAQIRRQLATDLHSALEQHQCQLYYQPIVHLATGNIHKAEALIRWNHPTHGLISPTAFIPIAEESGMIIEIGEWVFRTAVQQAAKWRATYHPDFQISVNKSPAQFQESDETCAAWSGLQQQLGLPGQSIVVEITEGMLVEASKSTQQQLLDFRDAGIQVALDDFGTGYSSLSYLNKFDIDYIKIDRSFVQNLKPDSDNLVLCETIIAMAHKLAIQVIAEGIETLEQRDLLIAAGCDYGQGFLFAQPAPAAVFETLLQPDHQWHFPATATD